MDFSQSINDANFAEIHTENKDLVLQKNKLFYERRHFSCQALWFLAFISNAPNLRSPIPVIIALNCLFL